MLDSSNNNDTKITSFESKALFEELCQGTKIVLPDGVAINFPLGWVQIVKDFISAAKDYSIRILEITDDYSVLDIHFAATKTREEVKVWRLIDSARNESKQLCGNCGEFKNYRRRFYSTRTLCERCTVNAHKIDKTGTWLDKY